MVVWELTLRCDLSCRHCGSRAGRARVAELDTTQALRVVHQLTSARVREVALIGGESYLRQDWDTIARAITEQGMQCSIVTGGRGVDAAVARRARVAGVANVSVSIDGLEPTHDEQRGVRGSHRAALGALGHLRRAGVPTSVNTQVNRRSAPELEALFALLREAGLWAWRVQLTVPIGRAADDPDRLLQPFDLLGLFPRLAALKEDCTASRVVFSPGDNVGYFGPYEAALRMPHGGVGWWPGCPAGERALGIQSDGTVRGCLSLPAACYAGANLRQRDLDAALDDGTAAPGPLVRSVEQLWGFCRTCYYAPNCRGGCPSTAHALLGRPGNNPYCHHRALEMASQGLYERLVAAQPAPGSPFDTGRFHLVVERKEATHAADPV